MFLFISQETASENVPSYADYKKQYPIAFMCTSKGLIRTTQQKIAEVFILTIRICYI